MRSEYIKVNCEICGIELEAKMSNCFYYKRNYIITCDNCYNKLKQEDNQMSEITKLYKNAGIKKCSNNLKKYKSDVCLLNSNIYGRTCNDCMWYHNPPFTAEKQLELIKWLGKLAGKLDISSNYNDTQYLLYFYMNRKTRDEILPNISTGRSENFEKSLAGLINNLWQDLTEEEKQQVRGILE